MRERFNAQKEIEDLAIITNNGFNTMFDLHKEQVFRVEVLTKDVDILKHTFTEMNQKLDLILDNMVTKQEFQSLVRRTDRLELALKA